MCGVSLAESRFGRRVVKLADGTGITYVKGGENGFPVREQGPVAVSCMTYREKNRYYVEVGIFNRSDTAVRLWSVSLDKPGVRVPMTDTRAAANAVFSRSAENQPPERNEYDRPLFPVTTPEVASAEYPRPVRGRSGTEFIAAATATRKARKEAAFARYLERFAHETRDTRIRPDETQLYIYTFEQTGQEKGPFHITVCVGSEEVVFSYEG
jgi:hypothetical protein